MSAPPPNNPLSATGDAAAGNGMEAVQQPQHPASPADGNGPYLPYRPNAALPPNRVSSGQTAAYSEIDSNPLPQIVFGNELPEVVKPTPTVAPDAVREDFHGPIPVVAEDTQNIRGGAESEKQDTGGAVPWYKRKSMSICGVIGIIAVVVILAAVFGALGGLGLFSKHRNTAASTEPQSTTSTPSPTTSSMASSSSTSSTTTTSSTSSSTPTPSILPILPECKAYSQYIHNISMVTGNVAVHGLGFKLPVASSLEDCCDECYADPQGCQIWVWDPISHPGPGQCTTVLGWKGDPVDDKCPWGHTNSSAFTIQQKGTGIMYNGPCGHGGTIIGN